MNKTDVMGILRALESHQITPEQALAHLKTQPFEDLGYAKVDHHRMLRQGAAEVIFGQNKTPEQIIGIVSSMLAKGGKNIIVTRIESDAAEIVKGACPMEYDITGKIGIVNKKDTEGVGNIVIASGGTSDMPVCQEAAITAEALGNKVTRLYDVGVAGIHRLLANMPVLAQARVIIAVAGMEGALASVIGGLVDCPLIAVPTSVGYGASLGGIAALLSMLNSCSSGVGVVNIDNGFGAAYLASRINQMEGINEN